MLRQSDEKDQIRNLEIDNDRLKDRLLFANLARKEAEDKLKIRCKNSRNNLRTINKTFFSSQSSVQGQCQDVQAVGDAGQERPGPCPT